MVKNIINTFNKAEKELEEDMNLTTSTNDHNTSSEKELNEVTKNIEQALWNAQRIEKNFSKEHTINIEEEIKYD